jgi:hypothetical protein
MMGRRLIWGDLALRLKGRRDERSEKSAEAVGCAGQRANQEGSSPSGARMRGAISEGGDEGSLGLAEVGQGSVSTVRWNPKRMRRSTGT